MNAPYLLARKVLLDALAGIGPHRDAMVLVGAQAIYLRVGESDLAIAPYTTDGDLAIDVSVLGDTPALEDRSTTNRLSDKDALDILRLLRGTTTTDLARRYRCLFASTAAATVARRGLDLLRMQFTEHSAIGVEMARRAVGGLADPEEIAGSCVALAADLLAALAA